MTEIKNTMVEFSGILNNNGTEKKIIVNFYPGFGSPYITSGYVDKNKIEIRVKMDIIIIDGTEYIFKIFNKNDEFLVAGREKTNIFHELMPCLFKPNFFVLTNKQEI